MKFLLLPFVLCGCCHFGCSTMTARERIFWQDVGKEMEQAAPQMEDDPWTSPILQYPLVEECRG